jgi:hypothetical protein
LVKPLPPYIRAGIVAQLAQDRGRPAVVLRDSPLYETLVELAELHDPVAVAVLRDSKTVLELRAALLQAGETFSYWCLSALIRDIVLATLIALC